MKTQILWTILMGMSLGAICTIVAYESDRHQEIVKHEARMRDVDYYQSLTRLESHISMKAINQWAQAQKSEIKFDTLAHD